MDQFSKIASPYDGGTFTNPGMVDLIRTYCAVRGYPSLKSISVMQGSFNTTVKASAGTHNLADCVDLSEYDWKIKDRIFRSIGGAIFHRTRAQGFDPHCHMVRMYSTAMAWLATAQDKAYRAKASNGLGDLSHKDVEWMPRYRGVKHLSGPEAGQFIASKPTPGYSQPGTDPVNDKDLVTHNRAKGYIISGVAGRVRCQSKDYFVVTTGNDDMTFYLVADFNAYVPGYVSKTEKWLMAPSPASATIYGRVAPGPDAAKKAGSVYPAATGHAFSSIGYMVIDDVKYVSTKNGTWFTATSLKPDAGTTPTPKPATSHAMTLVTQNEICLRLSPSNVKNVADWKKGLAYSTRVHLMASLYAGTGVSVVTGAEAGSFGDAQTFAAALGSELGGTWEPHLYGDGWDISQSITTNTKVFKVVKHGAITMTPAGPGSSHNIASWALLQHLETGIRHYEVALHLIAGAGATNDKARGKQVESLLPQVEAMADGLPIVYSGDLNSYLEQGASDYVGKAFKAGGYTDVETTPCAGVNVVWPSYNALDLTPSKNSRQYDRCFIKTSQVTARRRAVLVSLAGNAITVPKGWPSDHWAVLFDLTIHAT